MLGLVLGGCTTSAPDATPPPAAPSPSASSPALDGRLSAQLLQYSHDTARGRMVVEVHNDTAAPLDPLAMTYADRRLGEEIVAGRMREVPAGSQRSYPLPLPSRPACREAGARRTAYTKLRDTPSRTSTQEQLRYTGSELAPAHPTLAVRTASGVQRLRVADPTDVVERHVAERCLVLAAERVAELTWAEGLRTEGRRAWLVLRVRPTGRPGRLRIGAVTGTHLFAPVGAASWEVRRTVRGTDAPSRIALPVEPARCDGHAFAEGGNATAFRLRLRVGERHGPVRLRMGDRAAAAALDFAADWCGLG